MKNSIKKQTNVGMTENSKSIGISLSGFLSVVAMLIEPIFVNIPISFK